MDAPQIEGLDARSEDGVVERIAEEAMAHTPAVVVVSVGADGAVTLAYRYQPETAPEDVVMRLMCGAQFALTALGGLLAPTGDKVH